MSSDTGGTVFAVTPEPVADPTGTVAGFADASGAYLPLIATPNAARVPDQTAALLGVDHHGLADLADLALQSSAGADGLVLVPCLTGERTTNLRPPLPPCTG